MKEYCKKFSAEEDDRLQDGRQAEQDPSAEATPAFHDLRFVVRESMSLGFRLADELGKMLKKLEE